MKLLQNTLPALATLFWGGSIVWLYAAGRMGEFLVPKFHNITLFGGLGMIVLGLFVLLTLREKSDCGHDHCEHGHDHHDQNPFVVLLLMVIPLSASLATDTSAGYSLDVLARKGLYDNQVDTSAYAIPPFTKEMLEESTPQNEDGRFQLPLSQIFFSAGDESMMEVFGEIEIETEGQIVAERDNNEAGNRLRIYRTLMTCCAADAMVLAFPLEFENPPATFEERSWVRVGGTLRYETLEVGDSPVLHVEKMEAIPPPSQGGFTGW
ncbi:MAG: TIGR03943 family putative permease subunit [Roseibacillus sp.]